MPRDRHGPNKLSRYLEIHHTWMHQLTLGDFVLSDGVGVAPYSDGVLSMAGRIQCAGGLYLDVWKLLAVVEGDGTLAGTYVQTVACSYNAALPGQGNIFRYNGPHAHRPCHHVHRYDVFAGDRRGVIEEFRDADWPTLGEVLEELRAWYFMHFDKLNPQS